MQQVLAADLDVVINNGRVDEATRYGTYVMTNSQMKHSAAASLEAGVKPIEHGLVLEESTMKRMVEFGVFFFPIVPALAAD